MRNTPLKRHRPLYQRTPLLRTKGLRPRSPKMAAVYEVRRELVARLLAERPLCERCQMSRSMDVHEVVTRARGGSITDEGNCVCLCRDCHEWVHDHPTIATAEGWLRRGANMIMLDACCGLGGWTEGFKAAGFYCIGLDIEDFSETYPGDEFIRVDLRDFDGTRLRGLVDVIVASPPCDEFARWRMPWIRAKGLDQLVPPDMSIVEACYRIRAEIHPRAFVLENVRSAQYFLGQAPVCREPFYFWGDVALMPACPPMRQKQSYSSAQKMERARIPFGLAQGLALAFRGGV